MSFDLGVWYGDKPLTDAEAGDLYLKLCEQTWVPIDRKPAVDAFYTELTNRYPEIDTVPEDELDACPWSCAHDRSGLHVVMAMRWSMCAEIAPVVHELAAKHGLVCYDPQESKVYLPQCLKPRSSTLKYWVYRLLLRGVGLLAAILCAHAQELDPNAPATIAAAVNSSDAVVKGKFVVDSCWPWIDGWHCTGGIHVQEGLLGPWKATQVVPFRWKEHYGSGCFICEKWSRLKGETGIWLLNRKDGLWSILGTGLCSGAIPLEHRGVVDGAIKQRGAR